MAAWWCLLLLALSLDSSRGHGSLNEPPSRASAWRHGFDTKHNYDDDGCNCGGFGVQWEQNEGRCGVCGDNWSDEVPRAHELGGEYGAGVIVRTYKAGSDFPVTVNLTVYHKGFWQLRLCTDAGDNSDDCFKHILEQTNGETEFYPTETKVYELKYRLPSGISCQHCVLGWWYTAGNNWGDCENGTSTLGCGPQENFRACADITIESCSGKKSKYSKSKRKGVNKGVTDNEEADLCDNNDFNYSLETVKEEEDFFLVKKNNGKVGSEELSTYVCRPYVESEYEDPMDVNA